MKDILGYEGLYAITEEGQVWSYYSKRYLNPSLKKNGYLSVVLVKDKIKKSFSIHKIVAETYLPNPNNYPIINHKDENKTNNSVENLEWCSYKYNSNYGTIRDKISKGIKDYYQNNPQAKRNGLNNNKSIPVKCLETGEIFETFTAACNWCELKSTVCLTDYFNGKQGSAGQHPITKQKLHWEKLVEGKWIKAIPYTPIKRENNYLKRQVRCIETQEIFESITEAQKKYKNKHISECCSGKRKTCCGYHWEYVEGETA